MRYNQKMYRILAKNNFFSRPNLALVKVVSTKIVEHDGCILLEEQMLHNKHISADNFSDKVGYECMINHLHVSDYIKRNRASAGYWFLKIIFQNWNEANSEGELIGIIGVTDSDPVIRFYKSRASEPSWLCDDLEGYKFEAILEISSHDFLNSEH